MASDGGSGWDGVLWGEVTACMLPDPSATGSSGSGSHGKLHGRWANNDVPSTIVVSFGLTLRLPFPLLFGRLSDFVTARGPFPPAATGRPTPNRV